MGSQGVIEITLIPTEVDAAANVKLEAGVISFDGGEWLLFVGLDEVPRFFDDFIDAVDGVFELAE